MTINEIDKKRQDLREQAHRLNEKLRDKFGHLTIMDAMPEEEKQLKKELAFLWSEINKLVKLKNKMVYR